MKTNRILLVTVIAMTTLCAALVWSNVAATGRARELAAQLEAKEARLQELSARIDRASKKSADAGMGELLGQRDVEYEQLRDAYDKLKDQLAATSALNVTAPAITSTPARVNFDRFPRRNMSNFLERVRLQDPERYQEIVQRIQQRQQQATQEYDDQMAGLVQRAQAAQTPEEADVVSQISDTLDKINQLRQSRAAVADLPEDQQQAQMQSINDQLHIAMTDLNNLRDTDRTIQLQNVATQQLGLKGPDVQPFVDAVKKVYKDTQYAPQRGPGGPGGGGPPPPTSSSTAR